MKQVAWLTTVSLATLTVMFLLWEFRTAVVLFIFSLAVAAILRPVVDFLTSRKLSQGLALLIAYLMVIGTIAALIWFMGRPVIGELQALSTDLPIAYKQIQTRWLTGSGLQQIVAQNFPDLPDLFQGISGGQWEIFIQNFISMTLGSLDLVSNIIIVFALSIYWSVDQQHFKRLWFSLLPTEFRTHWRNVWQNIEDEVGAYLRSELIQSLLTLIFLGVGYQLIGLKYPILLALFGAIGWSIAWFGGLIVVLSVLLIGLSISPVIGFLAAFFTLFVLSFLEFIVEPRLFNRNRLGSLLVLIMVLFMVKEYGVIGFFIAPPLAAAISIIANQLFQQTTATTITLPPPPTVQFDILRERLDSIKMMIATRSQSSHPEILNLIDRLDKLVNRVNYEEPFT